MFFVIPFVFSNGLETFQALMIELFNLFVCILKLVFFDDFLVYSKNKKEHKEQLVPVLQTLSQHKVLGNGKKCDIGVTRVDYLEHII